MIIFGVNLSHDEACAAVVDGEVRVAIANERLSRLKHNVGRNDFGRMIPFKSIHYCCEALNIKPEEVDLWVVNSIHRSAATYFRSQALGISESKIIDLGTTGHHLAHAYSAYHCSPFEDAAVIVLDTNGGYDYRNFTGEAFPPMGVAPGFRQENYSIYQGRNGILDEVHKDWINPGGIGIGQLYMLYSAILQLTPREKGYYGNDDALAAGGKLMGYASYDLNATTAPSLLPARGAHLTVPIEKFVQYCVAREFMTPSASPAAWETSRAHNIHSILPFKTRKRSLRNREYISIGGEAQRVVEQGFMRIAELAREKTGLKNVCFAGGNALNITALDLVMKSGLFKDIFVQPASNDAGNAIGAALYGYRKQGGKLRPYLQKPYSSFLGRAYSDTEVLEAISKISSPHNFSYSKASSTEQISRALEYILKDGVVGICRGRSEFGPRALGHRSLLASPRLALRP